MYLLVRPDDHVLLGVSWSSDVTFIVDAHGLGVLAATGNDARLVVIFPPQHVAEQTASSAGSLTLPVHGTLSATSRLAFRMASGTRVPLTVAGVLAAVGITAPILTSTSHPPAVDDTAVELPWRVVFVPRGAAGDGEVVCLHSDPVTNSGITRVWGTRIVQPSGSGSFSTDLTLTAVDAVSAATPDPRDEHGNTIPLPLPQSDRRMLFTNASGRPAVSDQLELSSLGGTLSARGDWTNFQWDHRAVFGRDMTVRTLARGVLYPFGHRATYVEHTARVIDPVTGNAAVLRTQWVLTITDPLRQPPGDTAFRRPFPFDDVRITRQSFADLQPACWQNFNGLPTYFRVTASDGMPVRFPIECDTPDGVVHLAVPLLFVADLSPASPSLTDPQLAQQLRTCYGEQVVPLHGLNLDLVRSDTVASATHGTSAASVVQRAAGDVHEVHSITIDGGLGSDGYRPVLTGLEVALPALRSLLGEAATHQVTYAQQFLDHGPAQDLVLKLVKPIDVDFTRSVDKAGGLAALKFTTDAVSRTLGPVNLAALPDPLSGTVDPRKLFSDAATILGFRLVDLVVQALKVRPQITSLPTAGTVPSVQMVWAGVPLTSKQPPFIAGADSTLTVQVTGSSTGTNVLSTVSNFSLLLPPGKPILELQFRAVTYHQRDAQPPTLDLDGVKAVFHGELQLLEELQEHVDLAGAGKYVDVTSDSVTVHYSLPLPSITAVAFALRNVVLNASMVAPFDGRPLTVTLGFSTRANPFQLGVLMFGGGGYIDVSLDHDGLQRLEVVLEFGAFVAVDFLIASGEVHALGGVRFALDADRSVAVTGYLRLGGRVEVLGLVSVSVELRIDLAYQSSRKALVGRASLVIEVDLTLWSDRVTIDSGEWVLAGGGGGAGHLAAPHLAAAHLTQAPAAGAVGLDAWQRYRGAFVLDDSTDIQLATGGQR